MNFYQKVFGHHHSDPIRSIDDQLLTIRSFGKVLPVLTGKVHGVLIVCNIFSESLLTPSLQISVNTRTSNTEGLPYVQLVLSLPKASIIPGLTHSFFHNCRNLLKIIGITISLHHPSLFFSFPQTLPCKSLPTFSQFITFFFNCCDAHYIFLEVHIQSAQSV